eukprot:scaffold15586_cov100-Isochrysis_galbana.AAC.4
MTRPSVSSDWLMFLRSRSRASLAPEPADLAHSEPARSTRCSLPMHSIVHPSDVNSCVVTVSVKTQCERDECLFILVSPTRRRSCACEMRPSTSEAQPTSWSDRLCTKTPRPRRFGSPRSSTRDSFGIDSSMARTPL